MAKKKTRLQKAYASFNRQYFKKVLPADMDIAWESDRPRDRYLAYVSSWVLHAEGKKIELPFIRINKRLKFSSTLWKFSLLHEMNHLYVGRNRGHGPEFQKGMMRLAKIGALKGLW